MKKVLQNVAPQFHLKMHFTPDTELDSEKYLKSCKHIQKIIFFFQLNGHFKEMTLFRKKTTQEILGKKTSLRT